MDTLETHNYSFYAIPAYYMLALFPHVYAQSVLAGSKAVVLNNVNPKSTVYGETLRKKLPPETYARWERSRAAHQNAMEALPLFVAAVLMGNWAKLSVSTLNYAVAAFLAFRVAHSVLYINVTTPGLSFARSAVWGCSVFVCLFLMIKAANVFGFGSVGIIH